ncbi:MAG: biotin--[acetyl-CoA-carboxylase] ligase [Balneola sp.]|nr:MAG: biotin--[acetyl-CoA-carboxylase] ligase [Balneola sp.]
MFLTEQFEDQLATSWLGRSNFYFSELDSTNSYAKRMSRVDSLHGTLVIADSQTKGRGQYERAWESESECNLMFSLIFEPTNQHRLTILTLSCALAVADVCSDYAKTSFDIKWPNDVLIDGKKLCGLLTEAVFNGNVLDRVIVGIGININQREFEAELSDSAISLAQITDKEYSREQILARILTKIEYYYRLWETREIELVRTINKNMIGYGQWAKIFVNNDLREGTFKFLGVNEHGALVVLNKDLEVDTFSYEQIRVQID